MGKSSIALPWDFPPAELQINESVHVTGWDKGAVFKIVSIDGEKAVIRTPKTNKQFTVETKKLLGTRGVQKGQAHWRFEAEDWCSSYYTLKFKPTMDTLWPLIKGEDWNGKKHNYRLIELEGENLELQSNLSCGSPSGWHTCQVIKHYPGGI